ncbi:MAG: non-homologous end-joining DNA ligase [Cyclobacteriaceae bacterium]|jgi:DNA ligase D-like protein (predicted ligase)/DNA ligase D-like protein (predicted polymerase)/DNA ligase D-like protein (predicted 3'-phosphoesterase)|nr:non-homologous end-joining DNA ligase [Cyclobacteriaceae bacterium]
MAKKSTWVQLDKRKLELSNLDKVLFPDDNIVKAQVIEYYLAVAPTLLTHIKGRALTLIRFPEGIHGEQFYQKNKPDWAPPWLEFETLGREKKDYIIATEPASIVWMANLAALEFHQLHARRPQLDCPDYMVFDLDPPEGFAFAHLVPLVVLLKKHIEQFGYTPFVKTTGGKGLHICCPLLPRYSFADVFEAAQKIAQPFVETNGTTTTLHLKKEARKGRVLIDIYRMRSGQSIVSPYSLRGRAGAPVSMPLSWEALTRVTDPAQFTMSAALAKLTNEGDAWEAIDAYAAELHTHRPVGTPPAPAPKLNAAKTKTAAQLTAYARKRDFSKTPEPSGHQAVMPGNRFVVHRHHASHLHYDLRLEQDGVLKSWAVPKGLPPLPGIKRLAVQTEDHPIEYLTFDGVIPKGQYGAGEMWIYALGHYTITKQKKDGFYFRLNSKALTAEYRIYQLQKEKEWMVERVDQPQVNYLQDPIAPMLAGADRKVPTGDAWRFEVKWDGIRVMLSLHEGQVRLRTRNNVDVTHAFPELTKAEHFRATSGLFDGEIVCLDAAGKPVFSHVLKRTLAASGTATEKRASQFPVHCYLFDILHLDGRALIQEPLEKRRVWLKDAIKPHTPYRISEMLADGEALWKAAQAHALEGIMAKRLDSLYQPGKRTDSWIKVKVRNTLECAIIGYSHGQGERSKLFGGLHLAERVGNGWEYRGKVGTGFDESMMKIILAEMKKRAVISKPVAQKVMDEKITTWIEPTLMADIEYAKMTDDKRLREPVFVRLRLDV